MPSATILYPSCAAEHFFIQQAKWILVNNEHTRGQTRCFYLEHQDRVYNCTVEYDTSSNSGLSCYTTRAWAKTIDFSISGSRNISGENSNKHAMLFLINKTTHDFECIHSPLSELGGKLTMNVDPDSDYEARLLLFGVQQGGVSGSTFTLTVYADNKTTCPCKPIFTVPDLQRLEQKCIGFIRSSYSSDLRPIQYFYRNKPHQYFNPIEEGDGNMVPYIKDMGGDPKCPINGRINGLFFMGNHDRNYTGSLPPVSPFGGRRFIIPATRFFNGAKNLYFSDFFCMSKDHYISLVVTTPNSEADNFCRSHLLQLDIYNNEFLCLDWSGNVYLRHLSRTWVEVLYTDTINVIKEQRFGAYFTTVTIIGTGSSKTMGIPKRSGCTICNLNTWY